MPGRNRAALSLSPAQRQDEIIAEGLVRMPLVAPIPPNRASPPAGEKPSKGPQKALEAGAA